MLAKHSSNTVDTVFNVVNKAAMQQRIAQQQNHNRMKAADASVEVPKLHNIKLLIASFYTHIDYYYHDEHLLFCCMQSTE